MPACGTERHTSVQYIVNTLNTKTTEDYTTVLYDNSYLTHNEVLIP
jgi:hypothetical protein